MFSNNGRKSTNKYQPTKQNALKNNEKRNKKTGKTPRFNLPL